MTRKTVLGAGGAIINIIIAGDDFPAPPGCTIRDWQPGDVVPVAATPSRKITPREFMDRLSMARQGEVTAAAMQSAPLLLWMMRLTGATEVDLDLAETSQGVAALRAAGVITAAEAAALLA